MGDIPEPNRPGQLSSTDRAVGDARVVALSGEIDHSVREVFLAALLPAPTATATGADVQRIVVDFGGVSFMDSTGINDLLTAHMRAADTGGWLRVAGASAPVRRVLELVGIDTVISCYATVEEALAA
ncbi:STAS domain-containing protein [Streptomyces sp. J2-1]|uniref:STAS domain-containing protein n=1 Tax=Streptomyces corallincola TaxID=2851888 RepID=UPI001C38712F|nr:STAS domain-containing protein [Streptomyces corallincola]MBV2356730.1 STAS domain-containing protein [Streptomyces corallincola]